MAAIEEVDSCPLLGVGQPAFSLVVHLRTPVKEETSIEVLRANDPEERRFALVEMLRGLSGRIPVRMVDPSARPWLEISEG